MSDADIMLKDAQEQGLRTLRFFCATPGCLKEWSEAALLPAMVTSKLIEGIRKDIGPCRQCGALLAGPVEPGGGAAA